MSDMDYQSWRCTSRDTFNGVSGKSVFCPPEGCSKVDGCARDKQEVAVPEGVAVAHGARLVKLEDWKGRDLYAIEAGPNPKLASRWDPE